MLVRPLHEESVKQDTQMERWRYVMRRKFSRPLNLLFIFIILVNLDAFYNPIASASILSSDIDLVSSGVEGIATHASSATNFKQTKGKSKQSEPSDDERVAGAMGLLGAKLSSHSKPSRPGFLPLPPLTRTLSSQKERPVTSSNGRVSKLQKRKAKSEVRYLRMHGITPPPRLVSLSKGLNPVTPGDSTKTTSTSPSFTRLVAARAKSMVASVFGLHNEEKSSYKEKNNHKSSNFLNKSQSITSFESQNQTNEQNIMEDSEFGAEEDYIHPFDYRPNFSPTTKAERAAAGFGRKMPDLDVLEAADIGYDYGVAIDAGTSKNKVFVFKWPLRVKATHLLRDWSDPLPSKRADGKQNALRLPTSLSAPISLPITRKEWSQHDENPLHLVIVNQKYGQNNTESLVCAILNPLLKFADSVLRSQSEAVLARKSDFPVYFMGGESIRELNSVSQAELLYSVRTCLTSSGYEFLPKYARVVSGPEEGAYAWTSVSLLNHFLQSRLKTFLGMANADEAGSNSITRAHLSRNFVGAVHLGAGAATIAFEPDSRRTGVIAEGIFPLTQSVTEISNLKPEVSGYSWHTVDSGEHFNHDESHSNRSSLQGRSKRIFVQSLPHLGWRRALDRVNERLFRKAVYHRALFRLAKELDEANLLRLVSLSTESVGEDDPDAIAANSWAAAWSERMLDFDDAATRLGFDMDLDTIRMILEERLKLNLVNPQDTENLSLQKGIVSKKEKKKITKKIKKLEHEKPVFLQSSASRDILVEHHCFPSDFTVPTNKSPWEQDCLGAWATSKATTPSDVAKGGCHSLGDTAAVAHAVATFSPTISAIQVWTAVLAKLWETSGEGEDGIKVTNTPMALRAHILRALETVFTGREGNHPNAKTLALLASATFDSFANEGTPVMPLVAQRLETIRRKVLNLGPAAFVVKGTGIPNMCAQYARQVVIGGAASSLGGEIVSNEARSPSLVTGETSSLAANSDAPFCHSMEEKNPKKNHSSDYIVSKAANLLLSRTPWVPSPRTLKRDFGVCRGIEGRYQPSLPLEWVQLSARNSSLPPKVYAKKTFFATGVYSRIISWVESYKRLEVVGSIKSNDISLSNDINLSDLGSLVEGLCALPSSFLGRVIRDAHTKRLSDLDWGNSLFGNDASLSMQKVSSAVDMQPERSSISLTKHLNSILNVTNRQRKSDDGDMISSEHEVYSKAVSMTHFHSGFELNACWIATYALELLKSGYGFPSLPKPLHKVVDLTDIVFARRLQADPAFQIASLVLVQEQIFNKDIQGSFQELNINPEKSAQRSNYSLEWEYARRSSPPPATTSSVAVLGAANDASYAVGFMVTEVNERKWRIMADRTERKRIADLRLWRSAFFKLLSVLFLVLIAGVMLFVSFSCHNPHSNNNKVSYIKEEDLHSAQPLVSQKDVESYGSVTSNENNNTTEGMSPHPDEALGPQEAMGVAGVFGFFLSSLATSCLSGACFKFLCSPCLRLCEGCCEPTVVDEDELDRLKLFGSSTSFVQNHGYEKKSAKSFGHHEGGYSDNETSSYIDDDRSHLGSSYEGFAANFYDEDFSDSDMFEGSVASSHELQKSRNLDDDFNVLKSQKAKPTGEKSFLSPSSGLNSSSSPSVKHSTKALPTAFMFMRRPRGHLPRAPSSSSLRESIQEEPDQFLTSSCSDEDLKSAEETQILSKSHANLSPRDEDQRSVTSMSEDAGYRYSLPAAKLLAAKEKENKKILKKREEAEFVKAQKLYGLK